jgi:hypothetical protein
LGRFAGDARFAIPGVGTEIVIDRSPSRPAGWDLAPALGLFLGSSEDVPRPAAAYRWHAADPIPLARPVWTAIERDKVNAFAADFRVAMFWYSERPGPRLPAP